MADDTSKTQIYTSRNSGVTDTSWSFEGWEILPSGIQSQWVEKICSCGCWVTYGKDCPIEFHSQWCDLVRRD